MTDKPSHPIRNSVIAAVISGVLLSFWPAFREMVATVLLWAWHLIVDGWKYLWATHSVFGWLLLILVSLSIPTVWRIISTFRRKKELDHTELYKQDNLFGATWYWQYTPGGISQLTCLCPQCQSELVYSEFIPDRFNFEHAGMQPKTEFICERCRIPRASLEGDKPYALASVEREIRRRIRTGEWKKNKIS